jgi:hypothetical protein
VHIWRVAPIPSPSQTMCLQAYRPGSTSPLHLPRTRPLPWGLTEPTIITWPTVVSALWGHHAGGPADASGQFLAPQVRDHSTPPPERLGRRSNKNP